MPGSCSTGLPLALIAGVQAALAQTCAPTNYSANEIGAAIAASPHANSILKGEAGLWGAVGVSESRGDKCASNGSNFGVLQLHRSNLPPRITPNLYMAKTLAEQVDIWAAQVGNSNSSSAGYQLLSTARLVGQSIGSVRVTFGMVGACFQFGPTICNNDVTALLSGEPCGGRKPVNVNSVRHKSGVATTDGNGQTICSWGLGSVQASIDASLSTASAAETARNN